ncbi:MAG: hypothetical protein K6T78_05660 [Alicyclobacillus sp.]|nr:hypothetical protein [Alicyclobacillus sp.]
MNHKTRYIWFGLLFALVAAGLAAHSYVLLAVFAIAGILAAVVGDRLENRLSQPYKQYNRMHHRGHAGSHPTDEAH